MKGNIRILLVDDHVAARASLAIILRQEENMDIIGEASDGQTAIELTDELHPDVIVMDIRMEGMNGVEATRRIVARNPETKIIGFTMNLEETVAQAMERAGAITCLSKSAPLEKLLSAIRDCCGS